LGEEGLLRLQARLQHVAAVVLLRRTRIHRIDFGEAGDVGSGDLGNPGGAISGVDNTGQDASSVTFLGSFPPCDYKVPPKPFTHNKTWSTCSVYLVPGGITSVHYNGFVPSYIESPVTWR